MIRGLGGTKHTTEYRGLGAGQRPHRSDRGSGTVLVKKSLGVNRTVLGGPVERLAV